MNLIGLKFFIVARGYYNYTTKHFSFKKANYLFTDTINNNKI